MHITSMGLSMAVKKFEYFALPPGVGEVKEADSVFRYHHAMESPGKRGRRNASRSPQSMTMGKNRPRCNRWIVNALRWPTTLASELPQGMVKGLRFKTTSMPSDAEQPSGNTVQLGMLVPHTDPGF